MSHRHAIDWMAKLTHFAVKFHTMHFNEIKSNCNSVVYARLHSPRVTMDNVWYDSVEFHLQQHHDDSSLLLVAMCHYPNISNVTEFFKICSIDQTGLVTDIEKQDGDSWLVYNGSDETYNTPLEMIYNKHVSEEYIIEPEYLDDPPHTSGIIPLK